MECFIRIGGWDGNWLLDNLMWLCEVLLWVLDCLIWLGGVWLLEFIGIVICWSWGGLLL